MSTAHGGAGGAIVNISTLATRIGGGGEWVHYVASKGAIDTFTLGARARSGGRGHPRNAVSPGLVETGLHAAAGDARSTAPLCPRHPHEAGRRAV